MAHPPRIPVWLRWNQEVVYFLTFCVARRKKVLANQAAFAAFESAIARLANWNVIAAVLMPDHVHLLIAPNDREAAVGNASGAIKRWMRQTLAAEWQYIRENPVRAGLVENWQDWPYRVGFEL